MQVVYASNIILNGDDNVNKSAVALSVIIRIFMYIFPLCHDWGVLKIYAKDPASRTIYRIMAEELRQMGEYKVTMYGAWIEIRPNESGGKKGGAVC